MAFCRSCGAEIDWIRTPTGKLMPVDPVPLAWDEAPKGTRVVSKYGDVRTTTGEIDDDDGREWFISHFATCPHADEWRSKKESAAKREVREEANKQRKLQWGDENT